MEYWLGLLGLVGTITFLFRYYRWLKENKGITPFRIGWLLGMLASILSCTYASQSNAPWLLIIIGIFLFLLVMILNVKDAGTKHGLLNTLWQFLACALVIVFWVVRSNDMNGPKKKEESK